MFIGLVALCVAPVIIVLINHAGHYTSDETICNSMFNLLIFSQDCVLNLAISVKISDSILYGLILFVFFLIDILTVAVLVTFCFMYYAFKSRSTDKSPYRVAEVSFYSMLS